MKKKIIDDCYEIQVRTRKTNWGQDGIQMLVWGLKYDDVDKRYKRFCVQDMKFVEYKEGEYLGPSFTINKQDAQVLIDDLWANGLRPTEGTGSAGALKAVENHLGDMQKIAFKLLDVK